MDSCAGISRTRRSSPSSPSPSSPMVICGERLPSTTARWSGAGRTRKGRRRDRRHGDRRGDRALAVGRACQRDHPPDHAAGLARRHHRHRRDRLDHRVQPGRRAHLRLQAQRGPGQGPDRHDHPAFLPQGLRDGCRLHGRARRADDRPAHGDDHPERQWRDLPDRAYGDRDEGRRPPALLRLDPRSQGKAARRGRDQPAAREAAPEREDGGDGLAARRRLARAQQPAGGGGGAIDAAARIRARPADQTARREGARRGRALRPHRQELPRHGASAPDGAGRNRPQQRRAGGARSHRLRRALERHQHRHGLRTGADAGTCRRRPHHPGRRQFPHQQPACTGRPHWRAHASR